MNPRHIFILIATIWSCTAIASYRKSNTIVTTGQSNFAYRLEIHDFVKNRKFFTLYIRALQSFQDVAETNDKSFFGISAIHGLPYVPWNGVNGSFLGNTNPDWSFGGYCTHGTEIFPTWHRPYVLLYEQLLLSAASKIATHFTVDKAAWVQAAQQLRQPYWDWAEYALPPDEVIRLSTVTITDFNGRDVVVNNPLRRYKFQAKLPLSYFAGTAYANFQTTLRQPDANGRENIDRLVRILNGAHDQTRTDIVHLLTTVHNWDRFSNHDSKQNAITNSLETTHDNIHVQIGGNGHMSDVDVAAFDPIFFLHHGQVDRIITLWSVMNPGVWVIPGSAPAGGTFTLPPNATVDVRTDLTPFWDSQTTFWQSSETRSTSELGYAYADFKGIDLYNPQAVRRKVVDIIHQYMQPGVARKALPSPSTSNPTSSTSNSILQWSLRIRGQHNELHRPFSVMVFLGNVPDDHTQWPDSPNLCGASGTFTNNVAAVRPGATTESFVHLNDYIAEHYPYLRSFNQDVIEPFLKGNLSWRVMDMAGNPAQLNSLEVAVFSVPLSWNAGEDLPTASTGQVQFYPDVTQGKTGGSS